MENSTAIIDINEKNANEVLQDGRLIIVDFWAAWCGPCKMQGSILDEFVKTIDHTKVVIAKVNVDDHSELASEHGIQSIPTILFFKNGGVVDRNVGVMQAIDLKAKIDSLV